MAEFSYRKLIKPQTSDHEGVMTLKGIAMAGSMTNNT
jgi:hypothetical protein